MQSVLFCSNLNLININLSKKCKHINTNVKYFTDIMSKMGKMKLSCVE